jgi:tetratricopeptide (TPR) repeat protein
VNLAAALIDGGHLQEAEAPLQKASQLAPSSYTAHLNLGVLYSRRGLFPQAERVIRRALELNDKDWLGWIDLAVVYRRQNQDALAVAAYKRAIPLLETAVRVQPQQAALRARLAEMYAYNGDSDRSLSAIKAALALDPDGVFVLLSCADAYAALGSRTLAVATANKAVANGLSLAQLNLDPEASRFRTDPNFKPPNR